MSAKIFVGNLDFQTSADDLMNLLSEAGQVVDVYLPSDHRTGRPRGFAFVEFASDEEAAKAIELFNGREVNGRKLNVNAAEDRPARPSGSRSFSHNPPPGPGGGFGGGRPFKSKGSRKGLRGRKRSL
ncbi:MAG: RNA-binding protein [Candidatus Zixiibacteriota bacterium]